MDWLIFYIIGLIMLISGLLYYVIKGRKKRNGSLVLFAVFFFVFFVWYIPIENQRDFYSMPEAIIAAIFRGIGAVKGDSYSKETLNTAGWLESAYAISIMLVKLIILCLTVNVILWMLKRPYQNIRNWLGRNKKTYIFYKVNSKTINTAKSMADREDARIIFFTDSELSESEKSLVDSVNGIYFEKTPEDVFGKIIKIKELKRGGKRIEVFLFGDNDAENLQCMKKLCSNIRDWGKKSNKDSDEDSDQNSDRNQEGEVRVYIELVDASWDIRNAIFPENAEFKNLVINTVITEENFALNNLYYNSIFDYYVEEENNKIIKLLFVGFDKCSDEMLKTALWLGQMPGFKIEITVIEPDNNYEKFLYECPGIQDAMDEAEVACYKISYFGGVNYESRAFSKVVEEHIDFTFAFVNTGSDMMNCNAARHIMSCRIRNGINAECLIQTKNEFSVIPAQESWNMIHEVGKIDEIYTYVNITNSTIEEVTRKIHNIRQQEKKREKEQKGETYKEISWNEYCKDEYKRKSTYARTLAVRYKLKVIEKYYDGDFSLLENSRQWAIYEHMRWNVYTWSLGYVKGEKKDDSIKTHDCLIAFSDLSEKIQAYDYIKVDKETCELVLKDN